ncbi:MAG: S1C family serine protease [Planctomycetes bacterium]|nr:S1C family serine protease [Planctomycetota bacterium]
MKLFDFSAWRAIAFGVALAGLIPFSGAWALADDAPAASAVEAPAPPLDERLQKIFEGGAPETLADLRAMQDHVLRLTEQLQKSTVGVRVGPAHGSGVIIEDGYVLTAGHVIGAPNRDAVFILHDGRTVRGKSLGLDVGIDSGLMQITGEGDWPEVEMGDSSQLRKGQWVLALGHPGGFETGRRPVLRMGRILDIDDDVIQTDCTLVGGDSGGPLFDMQGRVIAIHSRIGGPLTANIHVPIATYKETWERLAAGESWGFPGSGPYIGVMGDPDSQEARIVEVYPDTPAEEAGIEVGDVIVKFDGREVADFASLARLVQASRPGEEVEVEVLRQVDGQEMSVRLTLEVGRRE